ncbi:MAG: TRAP transporter substrate-binding protein [Candidatus Magnetomorum sp.]|nr:TRAP transporter substrate-binding protein [Candidatus Magnetomorum sp.]
MNKQLICIVIGIYFLLGQAIDPVMAATYRLTYSIFFPATHGQCKAGMDWAKEVEKRTNGQVVITVFPGGALTNANQCYDGVVKGITDIGMSCFAYTRGRFPVMEAVDLPLGYASGMNASRVVNAFYQQTQPLELSDVQVMYLHAHGPGVLHTKKPVQKVEDLAKMKIRSTGLSTKIVEALGAVPVAMPQGSTYESLQKGVVEGTFGPMEVLKGWRQAEVIRYSTNCKQIGYTTAMFVVMNQNKWKNLPLNIQKTIMEVNKEWIEKHGQAWDDLDEQGRLFTLQQKNLIFELTEAEVDRWKKAVEPVLYDFIDKLKEKNLPGKDYLERLANLIKEYQK